MCCLGGRYLWTCLLLRWVLVSMEITITSLSLSWRWCPHSQSQLHWRLHFQHQMQRQLQLQVLTRPRMQQLMELLLQQCPVWWRPPPAWRPMGDCWESYPTDTSLRWGNTPPHLLAGSGCKSWCRGSRTYMWWRQKRLLLQLSVLQCQSVMSLYLLLATDLVY